MQDGVSVVNFGDHPDHIHSPGPNASHHKQFRTHAGAHLIFNAFWTIQHFFVHQMLMRDPMHQIDLGAIVHFIRAILRKFQECVENALEKPGLHSSMQYCDTVPAANGATRTRVMVTLRAARAPSPGAAPSVMQSAVRDSRGPQGGAPAGPRAGCTRRVVGD